MGTSVSGYLCTCAWIQFAKSLSADVRGALHAALPVAPGGQGRSGAKADARAIGRSTHGSGIGASRSSWSAWDTP